MVFELFIKKKVRGPAVVVVTQSTNSAIENLPEGELKCQNVYTSFDSSDVIIFLIVLIDGSLQTATFHISARIHKNITIIIRELNERLLIEQFDGSCLLLVKNKLNTLNSDLMKDIKISICKPIITYI